MQQGARFQEHARLGRQAVHRLQFVEELTAQFAHVLGVLLIEFQASRKTASAHEQLPGRRVVAVGSLREKVSRAISCKRPSRRPTPGIANERKLMYRPSVRKMTAAIPIT